MRYYPHRRPAPQPLDRVQALADHLGELAVRVKEAVADAVGETLARLARDAAERLLGPPPADEYEPPDPYGYGRYPAEDDPWGEAESPPTRIATEEEDGVSEVDRAALGRALTAGLAAAGWWLRRGRPWAAVGAGVAVAAAVAAGGRLGRTSKAVSSVMADLMALAAPLAPSAGRLKGP